MATLTAAGDGRIQAAKDRLAADGIEVTVTDAGANLLVHVVRTSHNEPYTWAAVLCAFAPIRLPLIS